METLLKNHTEPIHQSTDKYWIFFTWILIVLFFIWGLFQLVAGEKIQVKGGFGWDGVMYADAVPGIPEILFSREYTPSHAARLLPPTLVAGIMSLTGAEMDAENIIFYFGLLNYLMIFFSILIWIQICKKLQAGVRLRFLLLALFLLSFPYLKMINYYTCLTDFTAVFIGFLTAWSFFTQRTWKLFLAFILASFTWQIAALTIPFLAIFRQTEIEVKPLAFRDWRTWILALGITGMVGLISLFIIWKEPMAGQEIYLTLLASKVLLVLVTIIGSVCLIGSLFLIWSRVFAFDWLDFVPGLFKSIRWGWLGLFLITSIIIRFYQHGFTGQSTNITFIWFIECIYQAAILVPLSNLVCLVIFFGPVFFLIYYHWNSISRLIIQSGPGMILFFTGNLLIMVDPEGRHSSFIFPMLLTFCLISMKKGGFEPGAGLTVLFTGAALLFSKAWYVINTPEYLAKIESGIDVSSAAFQSYFWNIGYFMSYPSYMIQLPAIVVFGFILIFFYHKFGRDPAIRSFKNPSQF